MSGICSWHMSYNEPSCELCQATPADLFGKDVWDELKKIAEAAGTRKCVQCGFEFYRTTCYCPKCSKDHSRID